MNPRSATRSLRARISIASRKRDGLEQLLELQPGLTIAQYNIMYGTVFSPQILAVYVEGLRKAGLPEE
jgi:hypothetical protein